MKYKELCELIKEESGKDFSFYESTVRIQEKIFPLKKADLIDLVIQIGSIPENIEHDSSEEKLYAKTSDILLAKSFQEIGLRSEVVTERANCADVIAKSAFHNYSLAGDAKAFKINASINRADVN